MVSQLPNYYVLLSSLISGIMLLISIVINNYFQLKREEQQQIRQEKSEQQKWYREKNYDCYRTSIQLSTKILQEYTEINAKSKSQNTVPQEKRTNLMNLSLEFGSEFALIIAGYPGKDSKEFKEKINRVHKSLNEEPWILRPMITEIMEHDSRIKGINK